MGLVLGFSVHPWSGKESNLSSQLATHTHTHTSVRRSAIGWRGDVVRLNVDLTQLQRKRFNVCNVCTPTTESPLSSQISFSGR